MNFTVMLVDDDANLIEGLKRSLHKEKYRIVTCKDAEQALSLLDVEKVDVLVSDDQMPGMNGAEFLTQVNHDHPDIVSIMLSGQASMGSLIQAINSGGLFRFLIKPCSADVLITAIRQALAKKRMKDVCERALPLVRRQSNLLCAIERKHPGICRLMEQSVSTLPIAKPQVHQSDDDVIEQLDVEISEGTRSLSANKEQ